MTETGPLCDVCSSNNKVQRWVIRPTDKPARTRYLCRTCARGVQVAYDAAKPVRGAAIIAARLKSQS